MKNIRKFLISFILILAACVSFLPGCSSGLTGGPAKADAVTSNGGMAVQKGEYLYYVNGYLKANGTENSYGKVDFGAIYRTKLVNNKLDLDENGNLQNNDLVVSKLAGFEKSGFYIYGENIYYATPNTEQNRNDGKVDTNLLDFYRINLNGTGNTRLYKSEVSSANTQFSFYEVNGKVYLSVYDTEKLVVVDCASKTDTVVAEDVKSVVMPEVTENNPENNAISTIESRIYYTRKATEEEGNEGNILAYVDLNNISEEITAKNIDPNTTYTLKGLSNGGNGSSYLLYTNNQSGSDLYYCVKFVNNEIDLNNQIKLSTIAQSNNVYLYTDASAQNNEQGIITTNANGKLTLIDLVSDYEEDCVVYDDLGKVTILKVVGTKVFYYDENNQLFVVDLTDSSKTATQLTTKDESYDFSIKVNFDINGEYVYVYKTYTGDAPEEGDAESGTYLIRIQYLNNEDFADELVGELKEEHTKTEETEEND